MSDRHERIVSLLRELVATYLRSEANTNPLITITRVATSPDYRQATVFFTTIPDGKEAAAQIFLQRHGRELKHFIRKKSDLKIIPHLDFKLDIGERHRQHIDEVARGLEQDKDET